MVLTRVLERVGGSENAMKTQCGKKYLLFLGMWVYFLDMKVVALKGAFDFMARGKKRFGILAYLALAGFANSGFSSNVFLNNQNDNFRIDWNTSATFGATMVHRFEAGVGKYYNVADLWAGVDRKLLISLGITMYPTGYPNDAYGTADNPAPAPESFLELVNLTISLEGETGNLNFQHTFSPTSHIWSGYNGLSTPGFLYHEILVTGQGTFTAIEFTTTFTNLPSSGAWSSGSQVYATSPTVDGAADSTFYLGTDNGDSAITVVPEPSALSLLEIGRAHV